jgi:hypothetical protein
MRYGNSRQLQPARNAQLSENTCKVMFDGPLANRQLLPYLFIRTTVSDHLNEIQPPGCKAMPFV